MADYIHLNILSQAYIHIELVELEDQTLEAYENYIKEFVTERGRFFLHPEVQIDLALRDGSAKLYVTILGTIALLYHEIGNYKDFREGLALMQEDAKRVAESVISESLFQAKARNPNVIRLEARTGVIGSLKQIVTDLDALTRLNGEISPKEMSRRLERIHGDAERLLQNLHDLEDKSFVATQLKIVLEETPAHPKPRRNREVPPEDAALYDKLRRKTFALLGQYTSVR